MDDVKLKSGCVVLVIVMFIVGAIATPFVLVDPEGATRTLEQAGYSNIQITGYSWFACSKDDAFQTGFKATSATGQNVSGTVCRGVLFKASTIRFD